MVTFSRVSWSGAGGSSPATSLETSQEFDTGEKQTMLPTRLIKHMQCGPTLSRYRELGADAEPVRGRDSTRAGGIFSQFSGARLEVGKEGPGGRASSARAPSGSGTSSGRIRVESRARASSPTRLDATWEKETARHRQGRARGRASSGTWRGIASRTPREASPGALGPEAIRGGLAGDEGRACNVAPFVNVRGPEWHVFEHCGRTCQRGSGSPS